MRYARSRVSNDGSGGSWNSLKDPWSDLSEMVGSPVAVIDTSTDRASDICWSSYSPSVSTVGADISDSMLERVLVTQKRYGLQAGRGV